MKRLLLAPLLISISLLSSGFLFKNANVKKLFCKGSTDLSLFVNIKTGQLYIWKLDELFPEKKPKFIMPFNGKLRTKSYLADGTSGINDGLFRAEITRTYFDNGDIDKTFYEVNFNDMTGKQRRYSSWRRPTSEVTMYNKCEFKDLDKGLKIKDK